MMLLDTITSIFVEVDDFCQRFEDEWQSKQIESGERSRHRSTDMFLSEILTIVISFHRVGFRTFKHFYLWLREHGVVLFPKLLSYSRFIQIVSRALVPLCMYLSQYCKGQNTGISFIDATKIQVCGNKRINRNKVFKDLAAKGKTTMGWFYGFKLHIIINDMGELLAFTVTPGNVDDRVPVKKLTKELTGKLFGDKGYISGKLFSDLFSQGLEFFTNIRSNMKNKMMKLEDKILLRKRSLIETVNDQLKNISQLEHTRHRSISGFMINTVAALISYSMMPKKPSLNFRNLDTNSDSKDNNLPVCYALA